MPSDLQKLVYKWSNENATSEEVFQDIKDLDFQDLMDEAKDNPQLMWVLMLIALMFGFGPAKEPTCLEDQ